jgi:hypothetical protein
MGLVEVGFDRDQSVAEYRERQQYFCRDKHGVVPLFSAQTAFNDAKKFYLLLAIAVPRFLL